MNGQPPFRIYYSDGESALHLLIQTLEAAGLRVVKSFDLKSACAAFTDDVCPHHGTSPCDCQLVVLLIYRPGYSPISVILHSHCGQTDLQWDEAPETRPDQESQEMILQALDAGLNWPLTSDVETIADTE